LAGLLLSHPTPSSLSHAPTTHPAPPSSPPAHNPHRWTVNLRFLPEPAFSSPALAAGLLATHAGLLALFSCTRWVAGEPGGLAGVAARFWARAGVQGQAPASRKATPGRRAAAGTAGPATRPPPGPTLALLATGNLLGIAAARSLHYQFYAWYAQTLPLLLWGVDVEGWLSGGRPSARRRPPSARVRAAGVFIRLAAWAAVEAAWNTFPATPASSASLTAVHVGLVAGLWARPAGWTGMGG
jgi:alpha-1,3-mannosyltransferase